MTWPDIITSAELLSVSVIGSEAHDARLYTQGLFFDGDSLCESSGLYGRSLIFKRLFPNGQPYVYHKPPDKFFAEGAALAGDEIYLLSWREHTVWVLNAVTLAVKRWHAYTGEGWGLAFDGERLWRSDGSSRLYPHRPGNFAPYGKPVQVFSGRHLIDRLNELEWDPVNKVMLANIYGSDEVAVIDLNTGELTHWLDARPLRTMAEEAGLKSDWQTLGTALNGLALAPDGKSLWLTGKLWPKMYQVAWPPEELRPGKTTAEPDGSN